MTTWKWRDPNHQPFGESVTLLTHCLYCLVCVCCSCCAVKKCAYVDIAELSVYLSQIYLFIFRAICELKLRDESRFSGKFALCRAEGYGMYFPGVRCVLSAGC